MNKIFTPILSALMLCACCCSVRICNAFEIRNAVLKQTIIQSSPRKGVINTDGAAGAVSKEADKLFQQYANNHDTEGISQMLLRGELVYLPKGTQVTLIEYGFFLHKIRTKKGQILYIAREHITLDEPNQKNKK